MKRAAILIGIKKTGNLPILHDAVKGAQEMATWAGTQGFNTIEVFTDDQGPVDIGAIKREIRTLVESRTLDQMIVYFAGHGVNLRYTEYWLLSDAPIDTQAAINLQGSVTLARQCGIPHVVFISDACRTAAAGIQAQQVTGSEIFPNDPVGGPEKPIDIFFATILGKPSLEVRNPAESSARFKALYTGVLTDALGGARPELLENVVDGTANVGLVRPRPLRDFLGPAMTQRLKQLNLHLQVHQAPDARITSDPDAWISRVPISGVTADFSAPSPPPPPPVPDSLHATSNELLDSVFDDHVAVNTRLMAEAASMPRSTPGPPDVDALVRGAAHDASIFGPMHFETECGFKIRGARVDRIVSRNANCELIPPGELVRIHHVDGPAASALLVLPDETSVVVPAIPGFIAGLTFDEEELSDVAYEPSDNSHRWPDYEHRIHEIRTLRGVVAASARLGVFRLDEPNALELARRMQYSKSVDPSLALYAAYAYVDLQQRRFIEEMNEYLQGDLNMTFFDIAMLARKLDDQRTLPDPRIFPSVPLLGQGWSLLSAHRIQLPNALEGIQQHLLSTLWTQFTPQGTSMYENAIQSGEVW